MVTARVEEIDRLLGVRAAGGVVVGECTEMFVEVLGEERLDCGADLAVGAGPAGRALLVVEDTPHERMGESIPRPILDDEASPGGFVERVEHRDDRLAAGEGRIERREVRDHEREQAEIVAAAFA